MVSSSLDMIEAELNQLGYTTTRFTSKSFGKEVLSFPYEVDVGRLRGDAYQLGISMQQEGYPTYAPHWIHIHPPIDGDIASRNDYTDDSGNRWLALSRPPSPAVWDELPDKNMKTFLAEHIRSFWASI